MLPGCFVSIPHLNLEPSDLLNCLFLFRLILTAIIGVVPLGQFFLFGCHPGPTGPQVYLLVSAPFFSSCCLNPIQFPGAYVSCYSLCSLFSRRSHEVWWFGALYLRSLNSVRVWSAVSGWAGDLPLICCLTSFFSCFPLRLGIHSFPSILCEFEVQICTGSPWIRRCTPSIRFPVQSDYYEDVDSISGLFFSSNWSRSLRA